MAHPATISSVETLNGHAAALGSAVDPFDFAHPSMGSTPKVAKIIKGAYNKSILQAKGAIAPLAAVAINKTSDGGKMPSDKQSYIIKYKFIKTYITYAYGSHRAPDFLPSGQPTIRVASKEK